MDLVKINNLYKKFDINKHIYINEMKVNKKEIGSIYHNINDAFKRIFSNSPKVKDVLNVITQKISKDVPRGEFERLNDKENKRDRKKGHGRSR